MSELQTLPQFLDELARSAGQRRAKPGGKYVPPATVIWRYMSFGKFVSLVTSKTLFFPSLATLRKSDPAEGRHSTPNERSTQRAQLRALSRLAGTSALENREEEFVRNLEIQETFLGMTTFISCWYIHNQIENIAMWRLYGNEGVAISSTVGKLHRATRIKGIKVTGRKVSYIKPFSNRREDWVFHKRSAYRAEKEFRLAYCCEDIMVESAAKERESFFKLWTPTGLKVPCDLETAVTEVIAAPGNSGWIKEGVEKVLDKFGLKIPVKASEIELG